MMNDVEKREDSWSMKQLKILSKIFIFQQIRRI